MKNTARARQSVGNADLGAQIRPVWTHLSGCAVVIMGVINAFSFPPPLPRGDLHSSLPTFISFMITVVVGLMLVVAALYKARRLARKWALLACITFLLGSTGFYIYHWLLQDWSAKYEDVSLVVGSQDRLTELGRATVGEIGTYDATRLLYRASGVPAEMWEESQLRTRLFILQLLYVVYTLALAVTMFGVVVALIRSGAVLPVRRGTVH